MSYSLKLQIAVWQLANKRYVITLTLVAAVLSWIPFYTVLGERIQSFPKYRFVGVNGNDMPGNDCSNPDNRCLTIGYALSKAGSGDYIQVGAGTYPEDLVINKSVYLFAGGVREETKLQGVNNNSTPQHIVVAADNVTIRGFTITDANSAGQNSPGANSQGIVIGNIQGTVISENAIADVFVDSVQGGIAIQLGANSHGATIRGNIFENNGDGIYFDGTGTHDNFTIYGNRFRGNGRGDLANRAAIRFAASSIVAGHNNKVSVNSFLDQQQALAIKNEAAVSVQAENNWWGCNYGPSASGAGCSGTTNGVLGKVNASPWLKLGLSFVAGGGGIIVGRKQSVSAGMTVNSSGEKIDINIITALVNFSALRGGLSLNQALMDFGEASTTYTPDFMPGTDSVSATADNQTVTMNFTVGCQEIRFNPGVPLGTALPAPVPETFKGSQYSTAFTISQGQGTFTWSLEEVAPPGLSLNPITGVLSGVPSQAGRFVFTVRATDSFGCSARQAYELIVNTATVAMTDKSACTESGNLLQVSVAIPFWGLSRRFNFDSVLPSTLRGLPGSCEASVGDCTIDVGKNSVHWQGSSLGEEDESGFITYWVRVADGLPRGENLCIDSTVTTGVNPPTSFLLKTCKTVNCVPVGPGNAISSATEKSDQKAGSLLVYNVYTSSSDSAKQNTRINLTNVHSQLPVNVHLFFVAESCSVADSYVCLTENQTASFLTSDLDPGTTGYLVAVAVDYSGCPRNFNYLIGDEYVKFASGHAANLAAEAFSVLNEGLPPCDNNSATATLNFDGASYNRVPATLSLSNVGSRADGNDTLLVVNRIGGNLGTGAAPLGTLFGILYDDAENALSFNVAGGCQLRSSLSNNFPRTTPRFETYIPAGRSGWLKLFNQTAAIGMTGVAINFNGNAANSAGAFNQGHNLHALTLTTSNFVIPVFPTSC